MAFMFETRFPQHLTRFAAELDIAAGQLCRLLEGSEKRFNGTPEGDWSRMKLASLKTARVTASSFSSPRT